MIMILDLIKRGVLKMPVVPLGKFLRRVRVDHDERLYDMAKKIGVSSAFLSAIENGHKKASPSLINNIIKIYNLSPSQQDELHNDLAISEQNLNLSGFSREKQQATLMFARKFDELSNSQINEITKILKGEQNYN